MLFVPYCARSVPIHSRPLIPAGKGLATFPPLTTFKPVKLHYFMRLQCIVTVSVKHTEECHNSRDVYISVTNFPKLIISKKYYFYKYSVCNQNKQYQYRHNIIEIYIYKYMYCLCLHSCVWQISAKHKVTPAHLNSKLVKLDHLLKSVYLIIVQ